MLVIQDGSHLHEVNNLSDSICGLLKVINVIKIEDSGRFITFEGVELSWYI
jgi:hypothetical protein